MKLVTTTFRKWARLVRPKDLTGTLSWRLHSTLKNKNFTKVFVNLIKSRHKYYDGSFHYALGTGQSVLNISPCQALKGKAQNRPTFYMSLLSHNLIENQSTIPYSDCNAKWKDKYQVEVSALLYYRYCIPRPPVKIFYYC